MKKFGALATVIIVITFFYIMSAAGCRKKAPPPKPTPVPAPTVVPHIEKIVYTYNGNLYWMDKNGEGKAEIFYDSASKWYPSVSPDGWYVMYWVQTSNQYNLWLGDFKRHSSYQVTFDKDSLEGDVQNFRINNAVSWTKDSENVIYSRNKDIWRMTKDGFNQEALTDTHDAISPTLSKDNRLVFVRIENSYTRNLYIKTIGTFGEEKLTKYRGKKAGSPHFSPDGQWVVYTLTDSDNVDIRILNVKSKTSEPLTFDGKSHSPSFSYKGDLIIFVSNVTDKYQPEIWSMRKDKSQKTRITKDGGVSPSWLYRITSGFPTPTPQVKKTKVAKKNVGGVFEEEPGLTPPPMTTPKPGPTVEVYDNLKVRTVKDGDKLLFYPVIHFDTGLANIKSEFYGVLDDMLLIINRYKSPIIIEGHTDNVPIAIAEYASNYELSVARAKAVKKYMVSKGIAPDRITTEGFGEDRPIVPNTDEDNKYKNRRAEIQLKIIKEEDVMAASEGKAKPVVKEGTSAGAQGARAKAKPKPTMAPTPGPTPKLNFLQKIFKKKPKKKKASGW